MTPIVSYEPSATYPASGITHMFNLLRLNQLSGKWQKADKD
ncbi:MAG: hypothetical protein ABEI54_00190 [Candidatus Bipolaricaulia bacterium]